MGNTVADYWELNQQEEGRGLSAGAVRYSYDEAEWAAFPVSAILKTYREAYGLSLQDVSDALKIKMQYLMAIEQGDHAALPGRTFAVGYVRSLAQFLQLPVEQIVERFKLEVYDGIGPSLAALTLPEPPKERQLSRGLVVLISFTLLLGCWGLWLAHRNGFSLSDLVPSLLATTEGEASGAMNTVASQDNNGFNQPVPFELSTNGALVETVPQTPSLYDANPSASVSIFGTPIPQLRPSSLQRALEAEGEALDRPVLPLVEIDASALAWIQVRDRDGQPVVSKMLQAGQSHTLFAESGLELSTGSIENLTIRIDGQKVRVPAPNPDIVVTTVPLDASSLQSFGVSAD